jgi:hypothetical protein
MCKMIRVSRPSAGGPQVGSVPPPMHSQTCVKQPITMVHFRAHGFAPHSRRSTCLRLDLSWRIQPGGSGRCDKVWCCGRTLTYTTGVLRPRLGFTDSYSGIGSHSHAARGQAAAFGRAYHPKASYRAVLEEMVARRPQLCEPASRQACAHPLHFAHPRCFSGIDQHL